MKRGCSCLTCREYGPLYQDRVLFLVMREGDEVHVGVDELTEGEVARFASEGTGTEKAEITDWLSGPSSATEARDDARRAHDSANAHAA